MKAQESLIKDINDVYEELEIRKNESNELSVENANLRIELEQLKTTLLELDNFISTVSKGSPTNPYSQMGLDMRESSFIERVQQKIIDSRNGLINLDNLL
jgi:regulator of replication initiation timing